MYSAPRIANLIAESLGQALTITSIAALPSVCVGIIAAEMGRPVSLATSRRVSR